MKRVYQELLELHFRENRQMLFLSGPRQVGKTTLATQLLAASKQGVYLNWDAPDQRRLIGEGGEGVADRAGVFTLSEGRPLVVFDELHKYAKWRDYLKGFFDLYGERCSVLVTGSGNLRCFSRGGDSLMGRYFPYTMHPLSVAELVRQDSPIGDVRHQPQPLPEDQWELLWNCGGFPEPFLKGTKAFLRRWQKLRMELMTREDVRDLTRITEIGQIALLAELVRHQIGQLTSFNSLAKKVQASSHTIKHWLEILGALYYCYDVRPWSSNVTRSLLKEPKWYLYDWTWCQDEGAKAENFVASHLIKAIDFWNDTGLGSYQLRYVRDLEQREVDFLLVKDQQPWILIEVKRGDGPLSPHLRYFQQQLQAPYAFQVVIDAPYVDQNCFSQHQPIKVPAKTFLSQLI